MRQVITFFSDTHAGHQLGLMNPDTQLLDDSGPELVTRQPQMNRMQTWLWQQYTDDMGRAWTLANKGKLILIHNGDITWGSRFPTQLVSTRACDQYAIAVANLAPWYEHKNLKRVLVMQGTESHEWGEGSAAIAVSEALSSKYAKVTTNCIRHARLTVEGLSVDVSHHGPPPGSSVWVDGDSLRRYTRNVILRDIMSGVQPPRVLVRSHYHRGIHETVRVPHGDGEYACEAFVLPAYCGMTHYAAQATRSGAELSCGMVAVVVHGGEVVSAHKFWRNLDLRTEVAV